MMNAPTASQPQRHVWLVEPARMAVWVFLATVTMLFAAFSSALLIRRTAADWLPVAMPAVLWLNTALLVAASLTLERAKAVSGKRVRWLLAAAVFSVLFLFGQLAAWQELVREGVYLPTNPHSSFFYILTALHGLHLLGGLAFLGWVAIRAAGGFSAVRQFASIRESVSLCATYWHFLGVLWIYLFVVLSLA